MVIDCRGVVRFVAPIAPDADDLDAALDEVLAAAEQAEHARDAALIDPRASTASARRSAAACSSPRPAR